MLVFVECFAEVEDPRGENSLHDLIEMLFIALLATLAGATSCSEMADFGKYKEALLRKVLRLEHGIPATTLLAASSGCLSRSRLKQRLAAL